MKRICFTFIMLALGLLAQAQNLSVNDFYYAENDLTARTYGTSVEDQNGNLCALIKVETTEKGLWTFDVGLLGVTKMEMQNANHSAEIWVYVPFGVNWITIQHEYLGKLSHYTFPCTIEKGCTYIMQLITGSVTPIVTPTLTQQFLVINVTPKDALVTVDGQAWPVIEGRAEKRIGLGKHEYRIEASDYHTEVGRVEVRADKKEEKSITLNPKFGYLKLEGDINVLSQAAIYVGKANGSAALRSNMRLGSGQHSVSVVHPKYKPYERTVTISDGETTTLNVTLGVNYSKVTLKVDDSATEIYVDGESKGIASWTGDMVAGEYLVECRKQNHRASSKRVMITDKMSGEVIMLDKPMPINGSLVVTSNPSGAKVFIDGKQVDNTPMQMAAILIGSHTLRLEKAGCSPLSKTFTIEEGKTLDLEEKLDTGRSVAVKTDRSGDKIYVDGTYVGETPRETPLGFGQHTIRVVRNGVRVEKEIEIKESTRNGIELSFEFGRMITIRTDRQGDIISVDGERVGTSPVSVDLPYGRHTIHAQRDKKYADKDIDVMRTGGFTEHTLVLHGETVSHFVERGVNFVTLNGSYDFMNSPSFGFCVGSVKRLGWFVTAMSNLKFDAISYDKTADANGLVDGYYPSYSGETSYTRLSVMGGMLLKIGGPLCLRLGAGYGTQYVTWNTTDGNRVKISSLSATGVDATAGLQLNLKGFTISADAVTTNFQTLEAKIGLGYCWKRK